VAPVAEVHDHEADIYMVLEGSADLFLGGEVLEEKTISPGQHRGSGLEGATRHALQPGDLAYIPEGTPHLVDARESRIVYLVVKEDLR
jgi:mannose-6-phosphate isomerase-like protein (cupin superfamily)